MQFGRKIPNKDSECVRNYDFIEKDREDNEQSPF